MVDGLYAWLEKYESVGDFTHTDVNDQMLREAERRLGIKIPEEYECFLKKFGHGGIGGVEILGVGKNGSLIFEHETLKYRTYGLPNEMIVIENCDEWIYCVNSNNGKVVMWSKGNTGYSEVFNSFETYLYDRINDVLENR